MAAVLLIAAFRIHFKQHVTFLCYSHVAFSQCISLASKLCIHTVVLMQPHLGRNPILIYQRSDFHMISNLSIAVHTFPMHMLASLSVDEILLPKYVNWSTNFRGGQFKVKKPFSLIGSIAPSISTLLLESCKEID